VRAVAERVTGARGFELTEVEVTRDRGGQLVRLYVDKEGGIGIGELQSVSEEVSAILDAEDPIASSYTLEVSSPGLDRPLKTEGDYRRFAGRLLAIEEGVVSLSLEKEGAVARIPLAKISHARLEVEFPR
jgi:ribosome maturation factor RimP